MAVNFARQRKIPFLGEREGEEEGREGERWKEREGEKVREKVRGREGDVGKRKESLQ